MKIKLLPEEVINKIAAGEIVERPSSVLKELIENSIDAKATKIEVFIEKAGKREITVIDDGEGIEKDDLLNAVKRHYTSKIKTEEDLFNILSYGFRGEALASISAVSKIRITSRTKNQLIGNQIYVEGGKLLIFSEIGTSIGTKVEVKNIFFNTPAREKFLKSDNTENLHIVTTFIKYALSNPSIHLKLYNDNREIFNLYPSNLETRLKTIYNEDFFKKLKHVEYENQLGKIYGYIGLDSEIFKRKYLFINKRPVKNSTVSNYIKKKIGDGFYVIFIEIPPYMVDVNIHPSKEEVKFRKESTVLNLIDSAFEKQLNQFKTSVVSLQENYLKQPKPIYDTEKENFEIIGQVEDTFIIAYYNKEVYFIDQHVANERVMFEMLKNKLEERSKIDSQRLISPIKVELTPEQKEMIKVVSKDLENVGFLIEENNGEFYIKGIPYNLPVEKSITLMYEILEKGGSITIDSILSSLSCKMSITAGDRLTLEKAKEILMMWIKTENPNVCPHGRPIYYKIHIDEIKKSVNRL